MEGYLYLSELGAVTRRAERNHHMLGLCSVSVKSILNIGVFVFVMGYFCSAS